MSSIGGYSPIDPSHYNKGDDSQIKFDMCCVVNLMHSLVQAVDPQGTNPSMTYFEQRLSVMTTLIQMGDFNKMDLSQCKEMFDHNIIDTFNQIGDQKLDLPTLSYDPIQALSSLEKYCTEHNIPPL